jgi:hypothetical protein
MRNSVIVVVSKNGLTTGRDDSMKLFLFILGRSKICLCIGDHLHSSAHNACKYNWDFGWIWNINNHGTRSPEYISPASDSPSNRHNSLVASLIDSTRIVTYIKGGFGLGPAILSGLLIFIPASFIGVMIGKRLVEKIPQEKFRNVVAIFIFLFGLKLVLLP